MLVVGPPPSTLPLTVAALLGTLPNRVKIFFFFSFLCTKLIKLAYLMAPLI